MPFREYNWIRELKTSEINFGFGLTMWIKLRLLLNSAHYNCWSHCTWEDTLPTAQHIALHPMYKWTCFTAHFTHLTHFTQCRHSTHHTLHCRKLAEHCCGRLFYWTVHLLHTTAYNCCIPHTTHLMSYTAHCTVCAAQKTLQDLGGAVVWLSVTLNIAQTAYNPHRNTSYTAHCTVHVNTAQCEQSAQCEHTWHKTLEEEQWFGQYILHLMHTVTYLTLHCMHTLHTVWAHCTVCEHTSQYVLALDRKQWRRRWAEQWCGRLSLTTVGSSPQ